MSLPQPVPTSLDDVVLAELRRRLETAREFHFTHVEAGQGEVDDIGAALARRSEHALAEVDEALAAIEEGSYGTCRGCGEAISPERLDALPHALACAGCVRRG
jgi:DnaK suppressor protein